MITIRLNPQGIAVGTAVFVGTAVGGTVGISVAIAVGTAVGAAVGSGVAVAVGREVGAIVATTVAVLVAVALPDGGAVAVTVGVN